MAGTTEYKNKWQQEHKERINLVVNKGQKEMIKAHAENNGESVNGFLRRAIICVPGYAKGAGVRPERNCRNRQRCTNKFA